MDPDFVEIEDCMDPDSVEIKDYNNALGLALATEEFEELEELEE